MGLQAREESDFGGTFKWGADTYPCSFSVIGFGGRFVNGGLSPNAEVTLTIRQEILPATVVFAVGKTFTATDKKGITRGLKIASEGIRDCIYAWELTCDSPNQKA